MWWSLSVKQGDSTRGLVQTPGPDSNVGFNKRDMSTEKDVVKQPTFTGYIGWADGVRQYVGQNLEPDKSVRTILRAADNPQQQPRQTRRQLWQV